MRVKLLKISILNYQLKIWRGQKQLEKDSKKLSKINIIKFYSGNRKRNKMKNSERGLDDIIPPKSNRPLNIITNNKSIIEPKKVNTGQPQKPHKEVINNILFL